jgi:hypothetical protein
VANPRGSRERIRLPHRGQGTAAVGSDHSMNTNSRQIGQQPQRPADSPDDIRLLLSNRSRGSRSNRPRKLLIEFCQNMVLRPIERTLRRIWYLARRARIFGPGPGIRQCLEAFLRASVPGRLSLTGRAVSSPLNLKGLLFEVDHESDRHSCQGDPRSVPVCSRVFPGISLCRWARRIGLGDQGMGRSAA